MLASDFCEIAVAMTKTLLRIAVLCVPMGFVCFSSGCGKNPAAKDEFRWLDIGVSADAAALGRVKSAFAGELRPDESTLARKIVRVGVFRNAALVAVDATARDKQEKWNHFFEFYNFDMSSGAKLRLKLQSTAWLVNFQKLAKFEPGPAPEVLVSYYDCTECEAVTLLSAFRFDAAANRWQPRLWTESHDAILVDSDPDLGEFLASYECVFSVRDFDGDGWDDVGVGCRRTESEMNDAQKVRSVQDTFDVSSYRNGQPQNRVFKDEPAAERARQILCLENPKHALCTAKTL